MRNRSEKEPTFPEYDQGIIEVLRLDGLDDRGGVFGPGGDSGGDAYLASLDNHVERYHSIPMHTRIEIRTEFKRWKNAQKQKQS